MAAQSHTATHDVMFPEPIEKISFSPSLEHGGSESRGWGKRARRRVEMSLPVGYAYRDVTACGLRIQRRHCLWVTHTETSLPVGYEYRDVTASFFLFWLCFWNGRKRRAAGRWPKGNNSLDFKRVLNAMTSPPWIVLLAAARRMFWKTAKLCSDNTVKDRQVCIR